MDKVLFLHTTSEVGGSDVSLVRLVERLDRRLSAIVALPSEGPLVARLRGAGADVVVMPELWKLTSRRGRAFLWRFALNYPRAAWRLARLIRQRGVTLVHTNTIHNPYGAAAAWLARVPHVWHVREIVWQHSGLRRLEIGLVRRGASRIVVTSEAVASMFGTPASRPAHLIKIPNGVEPDRFQPGDGTRVRGELGIAAGEVLIGIVCRLDVWKGVEVFLDAARLVLATHARARFVVVGGALVGLEAYADRLQATVADLPAGRIQFTGWRYGPADMPDVHRALDVLVLASTEPEPFGLVVIEAMASGTPVVATAHGGPAEIVEDGTSGLLVKPGDPRAMAAAITRLIDEPAIRGSMGEAGRSRVLERYTADRYIEGIHAVYGELLGRTF